MERKISIMAVPSGEQRSTDPYDYILNAGLKAQDVKVCDYKRKRLFHPKGFNVLHLHKPEVWLTGKTAMAAYKNFCSFWLKIVWTKATGKKIVWTVNSLYGTRAKRPSLAKRLYALLFRYTDGFIVPTKYGANELVKCGVPMEKISVIPHLHCNGYYPNTVGKEEAKEKLSIPAGAFVFLFMGHVRGHKSLAGLIKAFRQLKDNRSVLVIAGKIQAHVAEELEACAKECANILVFPQSVEEEDLQLFFNSANMVVMPCHKTAGLDAAFLNLSFGIPAMVPKTENFLELQQQVGKAWLKTFSGPLTAAHLKQNKEEVERMSKEEKPDLTPFGWNNVAKATKAFYLKLLVGKESPVINGSENKSQTSAPLLKNKVLPPLKAKSVMH